MRIPSEISNYLNEKFIVSFLIMIIFALFNWLFQIKIFNKTIYLVYINLNSKRNK